MSDVDVYGDVELFTERLVNFLFSLEMIVKAKKMAVVVAGC